MVERWWPIFLLGVLLGVVLSVLFPLEQVKFGSADRSPSSTSFNYVETYAVPKSISKPSSPRSYFKSISSPTFSSAIRGTGQERRFIAPAKPEAGRVSQGYVRSQTSPLGVPVLNGGSHTHTRETSQSQFNRPTSQVMPFSRTGQTIEFRDRVTSGTAGLRMFVDGWNAVAERLDVEGLQFPSDYRSSGPPAFSMKGLESVPVNDWTRTDWMATGKHKQRVQEIQREIDRVYRKTERSRSVSSGR